MLYADTSLPIPENSTVAGRSRKYVYLKLGPCKRDNNKLIHNRILIGKVSEEPNFFYPNENYYKHFNIDVPTDSIGIKPGRKKKQKQDSHYPEVKNDSKAIAGYAIASYVMAKKLQVIDILESVFGNDLARKILSIASHFVYNETTSCHELDLFSKKHILFTDIVLTSQNACEIFASIRPELIEKFFRKWTELNSSPEFVFYDVVSISRYDRDNEKLAQSNIGMFVSRTTRLPLFYKSHDGSTNDFQNILNNARDFGMLDKFTIVCDEASSVKKAVESCNCRNSKIIIGLSLAENKAAKDMVLEWRKNKNSVFDWNTSLSADKIESYEAEFMEGNLNGRLVMYHSIERKYLDDIATLDEIQEARKVLNGNYLFTDRAETSTSKYCKCTTITDNDVVKYKYELDKEKIDNILATNGCFALFTTDLNINAHDLLKLYRYKNICEKSFENTKFDMTNGHPYLYKDETLAGKLFAVFVSLILRTAFDLSLQDMTRESHSSLMHCIHGLGQTACKKNGDKWMLCAPVSQEAKRALQLLDIPIENLDDAMM